jgi:hypothetical protein
LLTLYEVLILNLIISSAKELQKVLLMNRPKVTLLDKVLMGSWLNFGLHVFLSHHMSLFFVGILGFGLGWHFLDQAVVVLLPTIFVIKNIFLLEDSFHHLTRDGLMLLVVVGRTWIFILFLSHTLGL